MRRILKRLGAALLAAVVALLLAPEVLPPFFDRVYYTGPVSDHFDGARFFNPDDVPDSRRDRPRTSRLIRFLRGSDRAVWPRSLPVTPDHPPPRVAGHQLRVTWIGHATVLLQGDGINILTDPIWAERASPFGWFGPKRVRPPGVRFADLPRIDLVLVSHNHYDHLDIPTLKQLWARDHPLIVTGLGNDTLLGWHGVPARAIDWSQSVTIRPGISVKAERVHHWTSRWMRDRNRALWTGFAITLPGGKLFFAGDTGAGDMGWVDAAARDGPYRFAILPIGAFLPRSLMGDHHIGPIEAVAVFRRLGAERALAVHWGTFQLSDEAIDAPPRLLRDGLRQQGIDPARFRSPEPGQPWLLDAMREEQRVSGIGR